MKKLLIMLAAMAVSLSAMAGGEKCDGAAEDCMAKMQAKYAAKPWLGVEYDKAEDGRYVIRKVHADSPAEAAGFRKGDVILAMEGVEYTKANKKALKQVWSGVEPGSDVQYVVKRQGAKVELEATLAHVPAELQKEWIAQHMKKSHPDYQVASTN
jgi:predicted metalloprotease with PDZ domain